LFADASNRIALLKSTVDRAFNLYYIAGGDVTSVDFSTSSYDWTNVILTWSKSANALIGYINGVKQGATITGLGTWAGSLDAAQTVIGAYNTTPTNLWSGNIAHVALGNTVLSQTDVTRLGTL
jgi:hypothetical protein